MMDRPRGISRRKFDSTAFDEEKHGLSRAVRILRAESASLTTTQSQQASPTAHKSLDGTIRSESSAQTPKEVKVAKALEPSQSGRASQVTIARHNPSTTSKVNTRPSSPPPCITGTALDGLTGSPRHLATSIKSSWFPGGAVSMQSLKKLWHRNQVGTDHQSRSGDSVKSGLSVQSGKSKALGWFGGVKGFGSMGHMPDKTVRRTPTMDDFIKSGHGVYEGT